MRSSLAKPQNKAHGEPGCKSLASVSRENRAGDRRRGSGGGVRRGGPRAPAGEGEGRGAWR